MLAQERVQITGALADFDLDAGEEVSGTPNVESSAALGQLEVEAVFHAVLEKHDRGHGKTPLITS
jgi:hypothetical protein